MKGPPATDPFNGNAIPGPYFFARFFVGGGSYDDVDILDASGQALSLDIALHPLHDSRTDETEFGFNLALPNEAALARARGWERDSGKFKLRLWRAGEVVGETMLIQARTR